MGFTENKSDTFGTLLGSSQRMRDIYRTIEKCAQVNYPVFIVGETGTGKELVAREIYKRSALSDKPFVAVNMSAIPLELVASELFGHVKGSFTRAIRNQEGHFQQAQDGTLFLDEVLSMDDKVQVALLRVLETGRYRPVGSNQEYSTNARIITTANENPMHAVEQKRFRIDLLHRLQVIRINLPPLRKRKKDIPLLVRHFLNEVNQDYERISDAITNKAIHVLMQYSWPGNVRELRNVIFQSAVMSEGKPVDLHYLPSYIIESVKQPEDDPVASHVSPETSSERLNPNISIQPDLDRGVFIPMGLTMESVEKKYIMNTLKENGYNKTKTAKTLGLSRKTLYDKMGRWG